MTVDESDLLKIKDALDLNVRFHRARDEMNGAVHLAANVRWSPITSETIVANERLALLLAERRVRGVNQ